MSDERQEPLQDVLRGQLRRGDIDRRQFLEKSVALGLSLGGVSLLAACSDGSTGSSTTRATAASTPDTVGAAASTRDLTPTFYQWIVDTHPSVTRISDAFGGVDAQVAPVAGFDVARFVAEARDEDSTWDVYAGMTPFVEMSSLIEAGVIEPWDDYVPQEVLDDIIPAIREEGTIDGKLYSWPLFLDVIVQGYNKTIVDAAGLPDEPVANWQEFIDRSNAVVESGVAPYGGTFDAHGWRSLAPFAHSFSTDTYYTLDGDSSGRQLFDFTSDAAVESLLVMNEILKTSAANALQPGATDGGVNQTPDEVAFAAQEVAYYAKYQNAPLRMSAVWSDPTQLRLGPLPSAAGGEGSTIFWTTGACLFKFGQNKERAAEYLTKLSYDRQLWEESIVGTEAAHQGHLPPYKSIYAEWDAEQPAWLDTQPWVPLVREQLNVAKAIPNHAFGLQQFIIGQPFWEKFLKGEVSDPKAALQEAKDAVIAEIRATS